MKRALLVCLLCLPALAQDSGDTVTLLLKGGFTATGKIVRRDKDGVRLLMEFGSVKAEKLWTWDLVDDSDPLKPRTASEGNPSQPDLTPGVEVLDGARRLRGVVDEKSKDILVVRNRDGVFRFDPSRVQVRETWVLGREVLGDEELERLFVAPEALSTAEDYRRAGAKAAGLGLDHRANDYFRVAEVLSDGARPDHPLLREIADLRVGPQDGDRHRLLWELRRRVLDQSYDEALSTLDDLERKDSSGGKGLEGLRERLERLRGLPVGERLVLYREAAAVADLRSLAQDRGRTWSAASARVREEMAKDLLQRTMQRFSLDQETARGLWEARPGDRRLVASWGEGSWLAESVAAGGEEEWWAGATTEERYRALHGLYAESCCQAIEVLSKECAACGGRGQAWIEESGGAAVPCERCHGMGHLRVVIYR